MALGDKGIFTVYFKYNGKDLTKIFYFYSRKEALEIIEQDYPGAKIKFITVKFEC